MTLTGYLHPGYASSFTDFGEPVFLENCGGWILKRQIPGTSFYDAMGLYPIFVCQKWQELKKDIKSLTDDLVSLVLVADPLGSVSPTILHDIFPGLVKPFKTHYVINTQEPLENSISAHHSRYARTSLGKIKVDRCPNPKDFIGDWMVLYNQLVKNHDIKGIRKFSRNSFTKQMNVPGLTLFRSVHEGRTIGMSLWYEQQDHAYYHLGVSSEKGYDLRASFGMLMTALKFFHNRVSYIDLGGNSGLVENKSDGLARFKKGWSNDSRMAYLCGVIFNQDQYNHLVDIKRIDSGIYFPLYRKGEFT